MTLLTTSSLVATALLVPTPAAQAAFQGIQGTITFTGLSPLDPGRVEVEPVDPDVYLEYSTYYTNGDGEYSMSLPVGDYWLRFSGVASGGDPAPQWWGDSPTKAGSTPVTVTAGATTIADVELEPGGTITGQIAQALPNTSSSDAVLTLWMADAGYPSGYKKIGSTGTSDNTTKYTFDGLASGDYKVYVYLRYSSYEGWWQDGTTRETATSISVAAPETVPSISPVNLRPLGAISGRVTSAENGSPLEDSFVGVYSEYAPGNFGGHQESTVTSADGTYTLYVPAGTYRVKFSPPSSQYEGEFWNDAIIAADGQDVTVMTSQITPNINVTLDRPVTVQTNYSPPVITGIRRVGSPLTATEGTWARFPGMVMGISWLRNGRPIPGATHERYLPTLADAGKKLVAVATAYKTGYTPVSASSAPARIPLLSLALTSRAKVKGIAKVGRKLRAIRPRSTPASVATFQWRRNGKAIRKATRARYKLVRADRRKRISVRIVLHRPGYANVVRYAKKPVRVR